MRSALRETQATLRRPIYWAVLATAIVLTVIAGPFDTLGQMNLPIRAVYWGLGLFVSGLVMTVLLVGSRHFNHDRRYPWTLVSIAAALIGTLPLFLLFYGLDRLFADDGPPLDPRKLLVEMLAMLVAISLVGNARIYLRRPPPQATAEPETDAPKVVPLPVSPPLPAPDTALPLIFAKLPPELGRELIALRAQDHYVEAITPLGSATVLMRLSDAERDLAGFDGMRVHRSWWVNLDHVTGYSRTEAGGMEVSIQNGLTIPVARGQRAALRMALDRRRAAAAE